MSADGKVKTRPTCTMCGAAPASFKMRMIPGGSWTKLCGNCARPFKQNGYEVAPLRERDY